MAQTKTAPPDLTGEAEGRLVSSVRTHETRPLRYTQQEPVASDPARQSNEHIKPKPPLASLMVIEGGVARAPLDYERVVAARRGGVR